MKIADFIREINTHALERLQVLKYLKLKMNEKIKELKKETKRGDP